jgi:Cu/Ag efflux protein CusF
VTLFLHCHIPAHDKVGMMGKLIVGKGSILKTVTRTLTLPKDTKSYQGIGIVISTSARAGRLIVNHEVIKGFMSAMEMSYAVSPQSLLNSLNLGDKIRFTIDGGKSTVTSIDEIESAK